MVDITILTTILAKFADGTKKLVHYDPVEAQIYSQESLSQEETEAIKNAFSESFSTVVDDDNQPPADVDYEEILSAYRDQNWNDENEPQEPTT